MKKVEEKEVYIKDEDVVIVGNIFTYEVSVFVYYDNYVCLVNTTLYESPIFIEKTIRSFFINDSAIRDIPEGMFHTLIALCDDSHCTLSHFSQ